MEYIKLLIKYLITLLFSIINCRKVKLKSGYNSCLFNCSVKGDCGRIRIGNHTYLNGCRFFFKGKMNNVIIGDNVYLRNVTFWFEDDNNEIIIGNQTTMEGNTQLAACEQTKIVIGSDCMFSSNIYVRTTDSHSIIDLNGNRLNTAKDIIIGNHVWVGMQCLILKGANIPNNCIIGARSLISAKLRANANSLIAGQPAMMIKGSINWCRERIKV